MCCSFPRSKTAPGKSINRPAEHLLGRPARVLEVRQDQTDTPNIHRPKTEHLTDTRTGHPEDP